MNFLNFNLCFISSVCTYIRLIERKKEKERKKNNIIKIFLITFKYTNIKLIMNPNRNRKFS